MLFPWLELFELALPVLCARLATWSFVVTASIDEDVCLISHIRMRCKEGLRACDLTS